MKRFCPGSLLDVIDCATDLLDSSLPGAQRLKQIRLNKHPLCVWESVRFRGEEETERRGSKAASGKADCARLELNCARGSLALCATTALAPFPLL
ncbi:hypothetical protein XELAEV_18010822mg [Xenopus laevis]|uniref:Uncharacterized protein n=1 Tax=Xenopus laevis TaxID=8355 RepID=A0A974DUY8_XENLA|nr:hypothetical protein XELAEV_18010822mg [Xenopus laevis]